MKVLCYPEERGAEVKATLYPITNGWSVGAILHYLQLLLVVQKEGVLSQNRYNTSLVMNHNCLYLFSTF